MPFETIFVYGGILNTGGMREVKFTPQSGVKKLKFTALYVKNSIVGAGLAELQVYAEGAANPSVPTQDSVDRIVDFTSSPIGIRTGIYPTAADFGDGDDGIDWSNSDWRVIDSCGAQGKVLSVFDAMITSRSDPTVPALEYPREGIVRTFILPQGDMLKRIKVLFPPSNTGVEDPNCYITFSQSGNPPHTIAGNGRTPRWRTVDLTTDPPEGSRWSTGNTSGNIVTVSISAYGYRRTESGGREFPRIGIGSFQFDDITYGN